MLLICPYLLPSTFAECGHAHERLYRLVDPRNTKGHQPQDPQREGPDGGAIHERRAWKEACST